MYPKAVLVAASLLWVTVLAAPSVPDHRAHDIVERDAEEQPAEDAVIPPLLGPLLAPIPSFLEGLLAPIPTVVPTLSTRPPSVTVSPVTRTAYTTLFSPFPAAPAVVSLLQSIFASNPAIATASAVVIPIAALPPHVVSSLGASHTVSPGGASALPTGINLLTLSLPTLSLPTLSLPTLSLPKIATPSAVLPTALLTRTGLPTLSLPTLSLPTLSLPTVGPPALGPVTLGPPTLGALTVNPPTVGPQTLIPPVISVPVLSLPTLSLPTELGLPTLSLPTLSVPALTVPTLSLPKNLTLPTLSVPTLSLPTNLTLPTLSLPTLSLPTNLTLPTLSLPTLSLPTNFTLLTLGLPSTSRSSGPLSSTTVSAPGSTTVGPSSSSQDCPISYVTITQTNTQTLYVDHTLASNATLTAFPLLNGTSLSLTLSANVSLPTSTGTITNVSFSTVNTSALLPTVLSTSISSTRTRSGIQFSTLPIPTFKTVVLPTLTRPTFSLPTLAVPTLLIPSISLGASLQASLDASLSASLVIATTVSPLSTATITSFSLPPATISAGASATVGPAGPTGPPSTGTIHCGIHGKPIGDYYLATYAWNRRDVPITLEGCYQFCNVRFLLSDFLFELFNIADADHIKSIQDVWGFTEGCQSFNFYLEPGLGAARCDLYAGSVAYEVDSISANEPYTWFDLGCGEPVQYLESHPVPQ